MIDIITDLPAPPAYYQEVRRKKRGRSRDRAARRRVVPYGYIALGMILLLDDGSGRTCEVYQTPNGGVYCLDAQGTHYTINDN